MFRFVSETCVLYLPREGHFLFHFSYMKLTLYLEIFSRSKFNLKKHSIRFQWSLLQIDRESSICIFDVILG